MPAKRERRVVKYRRKKLPGPGNRYLQIAVTDEPGPRGGHTVGYVQTKRDGEKVYPGKVVEPARGAAAAGGKKKPKHGRRVVVRRKSSS